MKEWGHFLSQLEASLPLSLCGAAFNGILAKLITLSGSLCTLCHPIPELSPVPLSILSLRAQGMALCFASSLFIWPPHLGPTAMGGSHRLTHCHLPSTPFTAHSLLPTAQHTQGTQHTALFWSQSKGKSIEAGFLFSERGREVGQKSSSKNLAKYFRVKSLLCDSTASR